MTETTHPKISIIIPCYKVEKWVENAVHTLQKQTFSDYELFLVDDGSPDNTGVLIDKLAAEDNRIRVIHQANAGAAQARNNAIVLAQGDYLYFMDADDWCEETMLADLYNYATEHDLDLVVTGFYIDTYYDDDKYYREQRNAPDCIFESQAEFRSHAYELFDAQLLYAPWNKLYKRSYLADNNIVYPVTWWDDLPFNLLVVRDVQRVGCLNGHYYHFLRARAESENTKYRADMYSKREEENDELHELFGYWGIDTPEVREFLARRYAERLVGCIENVTNKNCTLTKAEKLAEIEKIISTPYAREAAIAANPTSKMMSMLFAPIAAGNAKKAMRYGSFISWVKSNNTNLFARLKANR